MGCVAVKSIYSALPGALSPWYEKNKRDLPWRKDREAYHIWLSEIMLQQTRVEAVKGYYARFLEKLPTIKSLATADEELLHKLWEGLGYYSRVKNLKKAACKIMEDFGGTFPCSYADVLSLPGIGEYTAGAICSIAFSQPTPAVDGNVLRVITRLTDDDTPIDDMGFKRKVREALHAVYPADAGAFTQALMELGATVCGPNRKPDCDYCPCNAFCKGRESGRAEQLPVKNPKRQRKVRDMTVFILSCEGKYALRKRSDKGLLAGMWEFPNVPGRLDIKDALKLLETKDVRLKEMCRQVERKHIFTHEEWLMRGLYAEVSAESPAYDWFTAEQINTEIALPTAFRQFWAEI